MRAPTAAKVDAALEIVRDAGYVAIREKSYRAAQERQRLARCEADWERSRREGVEKWARDCCNEDRRVRDRLTFVYGVARAFGASVEDLREEAVTND